MALAVTCSRDYCNLALKRSWAQPGARAVDWKIKCVFNSVKLKVQTKGNPVNYKHYCKWQGPDMKKCSLWAEALLFYMAVRPKAHPGAWQIEDAGWRQFHDRRKWLSPTRFCSMPPYSLALEDILKHGFFGFCRFCTPSLKLCQSTFNAWIYYIVYGTKSSQSY